MPAVDVDDTFVDVVALDGQCFPVRSSIAATSLLRAVERGAAAKPATTPVDYVMVRALESAGNVQRPRTVRCGAVALPVVGISHLGGTAPQRRCDIN
jgi:hypothetical protein